MGKDKAKWKEARLPPEKKKEVSMDPDKRW
jgi:hypothetical protein